MAIPLRGCQGDFAILACNDRSRCIALTNICDGHWECRDGTDEKNCPPRVYCPGTNKFIKYRTCDGVLDCPNGEDEKFCRPCPPNKVACSNHSTKCIDDMDHCDGFRNHCPFGTDEDCEVCPEGYLRCSYLNQDQCIRPEYICNGKNDCPSTYETIMSGLTADEQNCTFCAPDAVPCKSGMQCILRYKWCDGLYHCLDKSDESNCDSCPPERPFRCPGTSLCLDPLHFKNSIDRCDSTRNNEEYCRAVAKASHVNISDIFHCDKDTCIPHSYLCKGHLPWVEIESTRVAFCKDKTDLTNCHEIKCIKK